MSTFPTDAEREAVLARCIAAQQPHHIHDGFADMTCRYSDDHAADILATLAPHIAAREAQAAERELREAADQIDLSGYYDPYNPSPIGNPGAEVRNAEGAAEMWLSARADIYALKGES